LRQPGPDLYGFGEQTNFNSKLGYSRRHATIALQLAQVSEAARQRAGRPLDERHGERGEEGHCQERKLKAGFEELLRVQHQERDGYRCQQIQNTALTVEVAAYQEQG